MIVINKNIMLRPFKIEDAKRISELCNNKKLQDTLRDSVPYPYTISDAKNFIDCCKLDNPTTNFAIECNGSLVGSIGLTIQSDVHRLNAELGYWVGEPFWGKGIATEAVKLMVEYAFTHLNLVRLEAGVFDFNKASQKVFEKCGFKLEAIFEKSAIKNYRVYDAFRYGLINENHPLCKKVR